MTALRIQKLEIEDCEGEILREYFRWGRGNATDAQEPDWDDATEAQREAICLRGYRLFDGFPAQPDNEIGPAEIFATVGINSRVTLNDACRFLSRGDRARPLLERIPDDARLEDASEDQLEAAGELIALFEAAKWLGRAKVTKVLHKKRPAFFPMLDSVVSDFLCTNFPDAVDARRPESLLAQFRRLLLEQGEPLAAVQANLAAQGFCLTTVRLLDFLIWLGWRRPAERGA